MKMWKDFVCKESRAGYVEMKCSLKDCVHLSLLLAATSDAADQLRSNYTVDHQRHLHTAQKMPGNILLCYTL